MSFIVNQMPRPKRSTANTTSEESRNVAIQMYKQGATWADITKTTGLKPTSIRYHLKKNGIPLRTRK